ncbi:hypothetical protein NEOLI_002037 [Neolecta irregularis DAH-3]|uniref:BTB domain-containing protein n=1 Tax=Neolecta irregularis (strain DAH-3) TaxID=1198029 RepID=A0A1U7LIW9_NEOID|nr:hypothetical protein NEOLI_002037 [Neolecta irregularis DAH-3]|eukprot:OLL22597.1 hypothetical protein NEOLI_002037 [Neolecta irregularis DAH-3]
MIGKFTKSRRPPPPLPESCADEDNQEAPSMSNSENENPDTLPGMPSKHAEEIPSNDRSENTVHSTKSVQTAHSSLTNPQISAVIKKRKLQHTLTYTHTINDLPSFLRTLHSPKKISILLSEKWSLDFRPPTTEGQKEYIPTYLTALPTCEDLEFGKYWSRPVNFKLGFTIRKLSNNSPFHKSASTPVISAAFDGSENQSWGYEKLLVIEDKIIEKCKLDIALEIHYETSCPSVPPLKKRLVPESLCNLYGMMLNKPQFADLVLRLRHDGQESDCFVNRQIVVSRSEWFRELLNGPFEEGMKNMTREESGRVYPVVRLDVDDLRGFWGVMWWIYTDSVTFTPIEDQPALMETMSFAVPPICSSTGIYHLSCLYLLPTLQSKSLQYLIKSLNIENIIYVTFEDSLRLPSRYPEVKAACVEWLGEHWDEVKVDQRFLNVLGGGDVGEILGGVFQRTKSFRR